MVFNRLYFGFILLIASCVNTPVTQKSGAFKHYPYLQNPSTDAMTIIWFSKSKTAGILTYQQQGSADSLQLVSEPLMMNSLLYSDSEVAAFFNKKEPTNPYRHRIRITDLSPETIYNYSIKQSSEVYNASFTTAPVTNKPLRIIVYADSETEPESTGKFSRWDSPKLSDNPSVLGLPIRTYLVDQTKGYQNNLDVIQARNPDLILIAGDLVQSGGEQRDWDEFWKHNTTDEGNKSLASNVPFLAAIGNHEYYGGPTFDRYGPNGPRLAAEKFLSYFESPNNNALHKEQEGRYYSIKYGPVTLIMLDVNNNSPHQTEADTSFYILGENDEGGGFAPDFTKTSKQYQWLEQELKLAQINSPYTFVVFHQSPYSSGPHGLPAGTVDNTDLQSGRAVRSLTPLFMKYGVDAVLNGHDEMWERSLLIGKELDLKGNLIEHSIHFYDVGIGGDGLRAPIPGLENPYKQFLVHDDVPEIWDDRILVDGGKHYGHLEIDLFINGDGNWEAIFKPVYVFPNYNTETKSYSGYSRRLYDDEIILRRASQ